MNEFHTLMVGLPDSGKTTYLAAFWQAVDQPDGNPSLVLTERPMVAGYLEQLRDAWLIGKSVDRTPSQQSEIVQLRLKHKDNEVVLEVPDLGGEVFQNIWVQRSVPNDLADKVALTNGLVVCIHADRSYTAVSHGDVGGLAPTNRGRSADTSEPSAVAANAVAGQVQLVEILQFLKPKIDSDIPTRVAVMLSAWDVVGRGHSPNEHLERCAPLLHQFLKTNANLFPHTTFGVSAQGGDYADSGSRLAAKEPSDRPIVVSGDGNNTSTDITKPILWLITGD